MKKMTRFSVLAAAAGLLLFVSGCSQPASSPQPSANVPAATGQPSVTMTGLSFQPASLTVTAGTTVTWTNNSGMAHTVTADDGSFDSGSIANGASYSHTFTATGNVAYHCSFHGTMHGTVTVK